MKKIIFQDLGLMDYQQTWEFQKELHSNVLQSKTDKKENDGKNYLLFCEHPHVYTLGKSGSENNLLINQLQLQAKNATFIKTDRGGDITYHGPGQIVGYPILDLESLGIGVKEYVHRIEETIIETLKEYSILSERLEGATGVWLESKTKKARKICAIGVKVSRAITMHGFAFNVNTDLNYFNFINPCGFTDKSVTSLERELGNKQDIEEVKTRLKKNFEIVFGVKIQ
jgi:lipoyl(octanoyl) transferase